MEIFDFLVFYYQGLHCQPTNLSTFAAAAKKKQSLTVYHKVYNDKHRLDTNIALSKNKTSTIPKKISNDENFQRNCE
jgi:hypothetical protein